MSFLECQIKSWLSHVKRRIGAHPLVINKFRPLPKIAATTVGVRICRFKLSPEKSMCPLVGSLSILPLEKAHLSGFVTALIITFFLEADRSFSVM